MSITRPNQVNYVALIFRQAWSGLPVLLLGSIICCLMGAAGAFFSPGLTPINVLVVGLLLLPCIASMMWFLRDALGDDPPGLTRYFGALLGCMSRAMAVTAVPTALALLSLAALEVWERTEDLIWLVPLGIGTASMVLTGLGMFIAVPVRLLWPQIAWRDLWLLSLGVVAQSPAAVVAVVAVAVLGLWVALNISAGLLLVIPPLIAVTWAAGALTAAAQASIGLEPCGAE